MSQAFHRRHEAFTEMAYNTPGLLPDRYVFILTNLCNLKCPFCFQKKNPARGRMSPEDWIRLADSLPDYARVTLTGGEPLLYPGFKKVFSSVAERFHCNIITNGLLLTEELIDFLLSYPNFRVLSISIDTIGNTVRKVDPEKWVHLEEMMRYFTRKRDSVHPQCILDVKTTILDENAEDLLDIHRYCAEELYADNHSLQFLKGSPLQHADDMFSFDNILKRSEAKVYKRFHTIREQLEQIRGYNIREGKRAFLHPKIASLTSGQPLPDVGYINSPDHYPENFLPCKFPWSSVHINYDGSLFPCLSVSMGNVQEEPLSGIIEGKEFARFKELIRKEGTVEACNRCGWLRPNRVEGEEVSHG